MAATFKKSCSVSTNMCGLESITITGHYVALCTTLRVLICRYFAPPLCMCWVGILAMTWIVFVDYELVMVDNKHGLKHMAIFASCL